MSEIKKSEIKHEQHIKDYVCPHSNQQEFLVFDWLGSKIRFCLCTECQKISEFKKVLKRREIW